MTETPADVQFEAVQDAATLVRVELLVNHMERLSAAAPDRLGEVIGTCAALIGNALAEQRRLNPSVESSSVPA